jgi:hypothetical protein
LSGKLFDQDGEPLIPVHACKGRVRYRYYVSRALQHDNANQCTAGIRVPARELEAHVTALVASLFEDPSGLAARLRLGSADCPAIVTRCSAIAQDLKQRKDVAFEFATLVRLLPDKIEVEVAMSHLAPVLTTAATDTGTIVLTANVRIKRRGGVIRLVRVDDRPVDARRPQPSLINLVAKAHCWWRQLAKGQIDVTELAQLEGVTGSYITRVVRLAFLSPQVVDAILHGHQRPDVTSTGLTSGGVLPMCWSCQAGRLA